MIVEIYYHITRTIYVAKCCSKWLPLNRENTGEDVNVALIARIGRVAGRFEPDRQWRRRRRASP